MSHAPAVSVIMNCLNAAKDLKDSLESLFAQSYTDFEVIFFDNCSQDESPEIARSFGEKIRYFRGSETVPLGQARNLAIREAKGEYIAFLDCDDLWRPTKLEKQLCCFEQDPKIGLVTTDTVLFDGKRELARVFAGSAPGRGMVFRELMTRQWISMSSAVIRRKALAGLGQDLKEWSGGWFDERLNVCEEADVFYRIAYDWALDYVDEPLTVWRVHGSSTTFRKYGQFAAETLLILEKQKKLHPEFERDFPDLVRLLTERAAFQKAVDLWRKGQGALARKTLAPLRTSSKKHRLFYLASFLPGSFFDLLSALYFMLPASLRR